MNASKVGSTESSCSGPPDANMRSVEHRSSGIRYDDVIVEDHSRAAPSSPCSFSAERP